MARRACEIIYWADCESPMGRIRIASTERGLAYVELPHANGCGLRGWLHRHSPGSDLRSSSDANQAYTEQITEYFEGTRERFDFELDIRATDFQRDVYEEVGRIPYGVCRSYAEIAEAVGRPRAVRAVGAANSSNPVPLVVPCHRVIASNGNLHGYAGGPTMKARLLAMESSSSVSGRLL